MTFFKISILSVIAALTVAVILGLTVGAIGSFWGTIWAIWVVGSMVAVLVTAALSI